MKSEVDVVRTAFYAFLGGGAGLIAFSLLSLVFWLVTGANVQNGVTMTLAFFAGAGIVVWRAIAVAREASANEQAARDAIRRSEAAKRREDEDRLRTTAIQYARSAVRSLESMPELLNAAAVAYSRARETFADGAFSPFWSAIEESYQHLGGYLRAADKIGGDARAYATAVSSLARFDSRQARGLENFPVELDVARVATEHRIVAKKLDQLVYEAQKMPTFATIWEQRRTTSAVVEGFRNLEEAVNRMSIGLDSSLDRLGTSLVTANDEVSQALHGLSHTTRVASETQNSATRELTVRATEIRDHLYHPDLSRWLN